MIYSLATHSQRKHPARKSFANNAVEYIKLLFPLAFRIPKSQRDDTEMEQRAADSDYYYMLLAYKIIERQRLFA